MDRAAQTERLMRAMDNLYFTVLGHATGGCCSNGPVTISILSAAADAGILVAVNTDSHSTPDSG